VTTPGPVITEKTKVGANLKVGLGLVVAILGVGFWAGQQLATVGWRMSALESRMGDLPSKGDMRALENTIQSAVQRQFEGALVRCPRAAGRGESWVLCRIVFSKEER
jgi:hypothetical protein